MKYLVILTALCALAFAACDMPASEATGFASDPSNPDDTKITAAKKPGPDVCHELGLAPVTDLSNFKFVGDIQIRRGSNGDLMIRSDAMSQPITDRLSHLTVPAGHTLTVAHEVEVFYIGELEMQDGTTITAPVEECVELLVCTFDAAGCYTSNIQVGFNKLDFPWDEASACIYDHPKLYQIVDDNGAMQQQASTGVAPES